MAHSLRTFGVCVALWTASALAAAEPVVVADRAASPPTIDGKLDDAAWAKGPWLTGFSLLGATDRAPEAQTRFQLAFDDTWLYLAAELFEPHVNQLRAEVTERDGKVHHDDCLEFMLDPDGDRVEYYHFTVNPGGVQYDSELRQAGHVCTLEWDCTWRVATKVGAAAWTVEMAIPLVELGLNERSRGPWAFNVTRERKAGKRELSSFAPMLGGFHQPERFAALRLTNARIDRFLWAIKPAYGTRTAPGGRGLVFSGKTYVTNQTGKFRFFSLVAKLIGKRGTQSAAAVPAGLDKGQAREYEFAVPTQEQGSQMLRLELVDRRNPATVYAVKHTLVTVSYVPVYVTLTRPGYRDCIYATQRLSELEMDVKVALPAPRLKGCALRVALCAQGSQTAVAVKKAAPVQEANSLRLPIPGLEVGAYTLGVQVIGRDGSVLHEVSKLVRKLPAVQHEWRIGEHGVLLHNGEPYLPFGWFSIPFEDMAKPDCPYTAMQKYNSQYYPVEKVRANLDQAAAAGTYVAIYPYPTNRMMSPASVWGKPLTQAEADALRERIRALKDHPGLLGWYMADEPELRPALPERTRQIYEVVALEDPFHPCIMLNDTVAGIYKYVDGGDVLMPDPYPCFIRGKHAASPIEKVGAFMRACQDAGDGKKAAWITPQAFNYGDCGRLNNRAPNFAELRNMCFQAVVYGAKGFLWFTYSHCRNYTDIRVGMPFLAREVALLKPAVLAPTLANAVEIEAAQPKHLHVSARQAAGIVYIFAVNTATESQQVRLKPKWPKRPQRAHVVSEGRSIPVGDDGAFADQFGPYAAHVYTSSALRSNLPNIAAVHAEIAGLEAERKRPGNLAFEDSGVEVTVSSRSRYGSTPARVVDGVRDGMCWRDGTRRKLPDWLQLTWPRPVKIGRVAVYSDTAAAVELQVPDGEDWRTVSSAEPSREARLDARFSPVETKALRVLVAATREGCDYTTIHEVEAYAQ